MLYVPGDDMFPSYLTIPSAPVLVTSVPAVRENPYPFQSPTQSFSVPDCGFSGTAEARSRGMGAT